ncbi:MAG: thiamine phosphate synthase [Candidatus Omnitrophica bacterium]|nr:thiamine phosphate synthase [Candidatus Omnitrophota bacterium]
MPLKKNLCRNWKLYVITDPGALKAASIEGAVRLAVEGGASAVQLRDKKASNAELISLAKKLLAITRPKGVPLLVNDRALVAKLSGADGLHLGQGDGSLAKARALLGEEALIGRSTHSPEQALAAEKDGFDYIGVGPVFATPTKPGAQPVGLELVRFAAANVRIPFVAIGGIDAGNIRQVSEAGAKTVAVVRAVMCAEDPKRAAEDLRKRLK